MRKLSLLREYSSSSWCLLKISRASKRKSGICKGHHYSKKARMEIVDVVYGIVELPPYVMAIIKTPLFQRLKNVSQLGTMPFMLPSANHTRWEHCIGTYTRARKMLDCLENNSCNNYKIPDLYRKAVEIAALLHDVGHGPFSHTWESVCAGSFHHEENAFACIDEIFKQLPEPCLHELKKHKNYGIELIKAIIVGDIKRLSEALPKQYNFIFEIVNNKRCDIDVDKWDYLKRDHFYLKKLCNPNMNFEDVFLEARIANDGSCIEYRYEDYDKIYTLFTARWHLHLKCYRLPKLLACDALLRRMINRCKVTINGLRLCEINAASDSDAFRQLHNKSVLAILKDDEDFKYLENLQRFVEVNKDCVDTNQLNLIVIDDVLLGPGTTMPPDERIRLYGNPADKKCITRNKQKNQILFYYKLV